MFGRHGERNGTKLIGEKKGDDAVRVINLLL